LVVGSPALVNTAEGLKYSAQSPDEVALVQAARNFGYVFLGRSRNDLECLIGGERCVRWFGNMSRRVQRSLIALFCLETRDGQCTGCPSRCCTASRSRRSASVCPPSSSYPTVPSACSARVCRGRASPAPSWRAHSSHGKILARWRPGTAGADNIILERSASGQDELTAQLEQHLGDFSRNGLRTLCYAYRDVDGEQLGGWVQQVEDGMPRPHAARPVRSHH